MIHLLSGLKTSVGVWVKGGQQGAVKYSMQLSKWNPATCAKTRKLRNNKKHLKQSPNAAKVFFPPVASWLLPGRSTRSLGMQHVPLIQAL